MNSEILGKLMQTNRSNLKNDCAKIKTCAVAGDVSKWDTSRVTSMQGMFRDVPSFNGDVAKWDTSKVTNVKDMFNIDAYRGVSPRIANWDLGKAVFNSQRIRPEDKASVVFGLKGFVNNGLSDETKKTMQEILEQHDAEIH